MKILHYPNLPALILILFNGCLAPQVLASKSAETATAIKEESLEDYKARMAWFAQAQYGMFIHFGLYSQLGGQWQEKPYDKYAEWIQAVANISKADYVELMDDFNPTEFDADRIVRAARDAGMTYLVITAKHHEGFCLWDSAYTDYDVAGTPFAGRDILAELRDACDQYGLRFGLYYSIVDWNHPALEPDEITRKARFRWKHIELVEGREQEYFDYQRNQVLELIEKYKPAILWFDGDWADWWTLEEGVKLYNAIRNADPEVIVNNRVAKRNTFELDYVTQEQGHFDEVFPKYWEGCYTMNKSWGYKKHDHDWKDAETVYNKLKDINEKGGSLLLNVGPDGRGVVQPEAYHIMEATAELLRANPVEKVIPEVTTVPGIVEGSARIAWRRLVEKALRDRPEFQYVGNNPSLPNVLIYGDSISMGYGPELRRQLADEANVYRIHLNGGNTTTFIPKMKDMQTAMRDPLLDEPWTFDWDVIQFNMGLHDLAYYRADNGERDKIKGQVAVPIEEYKENLERIIAYLRELAPEATLIFATTTPVPEGDRGRKAGDAARYNKAAMEVLREHPDILINDLYSFTKPNQPQWWSQPGNVHYNETAKIEQGREVADFIRRAGSLSF